MSVRSGILAILTLGPAYGLQIHAELLDRAAHRRQVNVGQIYGTLERLVQADLVRGSGETDDGLPLYALTPLGDADAAAWLRGESGVVDDDWDEMLDHVLVASSIPDADIDAVLRAYEERLSHAGELPSSTDEPASRTAQSDLARFADEAYREAVRHFLSGARERLLSDDATPPTRPLGADRPRRGRRSTTPATPIH